MSDQLRVFIIDDEPLAIRRLTRLLTETGRVRIVGDTTEPASIVETLPTLSLDALFLDIQMPDVNGFELLAKLKNYPPVIFTTAFDEYALRAFEVNSLDYLLKPVEAERLENALTKLEKRRSERLSAAPIDFEKIIQNLAATLAPPPRALERFPSRAGGRVQFVPVTEITHFFAQDKLTFASTVEGKRFPLDFSIAEIEKKIDTRTFIRIHRNALVNTAFIDEVHGWFSGRVMIRLKNKTCSELIVARDRVRLLKDTLNL
jgi:two-component system LytT family response regulator